MANNAGDAGDAGNPLDIALVRELVLQYVSAGGGGGTDSHSHSRSHSRYLLPCRLVCRAWNERATQMLTNRGWRVRLDNSNVQEYLTLITATEHERQEQMQMQGQEQVHRTPTLPLSLHLDFSISVQSCQLVFYTVLKIAQLQRISSLECTIGQYNVYWIWVKLIAIAAQNLRHIGLRLSLSRALEPRTDVAQFFPEELQLPLLESFQLQYTFLRRRTEDLIHAFLGRARTRAPNLERLTICCTGAGSQFPQTSFLLDVHSFIRELDINLLEDNADLLDMQDIRFEQLRVLRVSCRGNASRFGLSDDLHNLTWILAHNAPALDSLEISDATSMSTPTATGSIGVPDADAGPNASLMHMLLAADGGTEELPNLKHFGYFMAPFNPVAVVPADDDPAHRRRMRDVEVTVTAMRSFRNLTTFATNLNFCVTLANLFKSQGGTWNKERGTVSNVPPLFQESSWPDVLSMTLSVSKADLLANKELLRIIGFLIKEIFPYLMEVVIVLQPTPTALPQSQPSDPNRASGLKYVLKLASSIRPLDRLHITNYTSEWALGLRAGLDAVQHFRRKRQKVLVHESREPFVICATLHDFTLRAAKRQAQAAGGGGGEQAPAFCLFKFLACIPLCWTRIVRIDPELLLGPTCLTGKCYADLLEEMRESEGYLELL